MAQKLIITRAKANKYRNRKTVVDGLTFDSAREAQRYFELKILQRNGLISDLRRQVKYSLEVNGKKVCDYIADFVYVRDGAEIVEDSKGFRTEVYILKRKLMAAVWNIKILET